MNLIIENIINGWYKTHLELSRKEANEERIRMNKLTGEQDFNAGRWFKERILKVRWAIFIPGVLEPSDTTKQFLLKEFYKFHSAKFTV